MNLQDFDFTLPTQLIAQHPQANRTSSRLLQVAAGGRYSDHTFADLPNLLRANDVLVLNDSKVMPTLLFGHIARSKLPIKVYLTAAKGQGRWQALAKPWAKLKDEDEIIFGPDFKAFACRHGTELILTFDLQADEFAQLLQRYGAMPVPPYIKRSQPHPEDRWRYQTVYAKQEGSVAAPTAGLHFSAQLLADLAHQGVGMATLTLHVGMGTFMPIRCNDIAQHRMHPESFIVSQQTCDTINQARAQGGRIVCVGTTSLRVLESIADRQGQLHPQSGTIQIFIKPGYQFKAVDLLITNFHVPKSTLFILVCAFLGIDKAKAAYDHAIAQAYRFYSYGDASLLELG